MQLTRPTAIDARDRSADGRGHTALVTGASSGIGRAMSELLAAKGYDVVVVARRTARLEELADNLAQRYGVTATPLTVDLSEPSATTDIAAAVADGPVIDFLVNNAGYSRIGQFADVDWAEHERRMRVLALAPVELTHRFLPGMMDTGWGRVLNVGSIAGLFTAYPQDVLYSATKVMVERFTEGLAAECASAGVHCTVSIPGFTDTEIYDSSGFSEHVRSRRSYRLAMMQPETVARQAYAAVMTGRRRIVHGAHHQLMAAALLHLPLPVRRALAVKTSGDIEPNAELVSR
jgi:short-subunit dehydrogenase